MALSFNIPIANKIEPKQTENYLAALGLQENSLGVLQTVVSKLATVQKTENIELGSLKHLLFCADHGVYDLSHKGREAKFTSTEHLQQVLAGDSPIAKLCETSGVDLLAIDCGLNGRELSPHPNFLNRRVANGTRDFSTVQAMSSEQLEAAVAVGRDVASMQMAEGHKVVSLGAIGNGSTTSAAAITMALLNLSADAAVHNLNRYDSVLTDTKVKVLTQALQLHTDIPKQCWPVVQHLGGLEIAAIMGAMGSVAELGGCFLVDGFACTAALLALSEAYPRILDHCIFTHSSSHAAQNTVISHLGQRALLNLNLSIGEGTGSVIAWPIIQTAVLLSQQKPQ